MSSWSEWDDMMKYPEAYEIRKKEREEMRDACVERGQCPDCGARLFRGLCPKCNFDAHPERAVKKKMFPTEV